MGIAEQCNTHHGGYCIDNKDQVEHAHSPTKELVRKRVTQCELIKYVGCLNVLVCNMTLLVVGILCCVTGS